MFCGGIRISAGVQYAAAPNSSPPCSKFGVALFREDKPRRTRSNKGAKDGGSSKRLASMFCANQRGRRCDRTTRTGQGGVTGDAPSLPPLSTGRCRATAVHGLQGVPREHQAAGIDRGVVSLGSRERYRMQRLVE